MPNPNDKTTSDPPPPPRPVPQDIATALAKGANNLNQTDRDALLIAIARVVLHL